MKLEILKDKNIKALISLDIEGKENLLKKSKMFLGTAESIVSKNLKHDAVSPFLQEAQQAYVECAQHMQKKNCL